MNFSNPSSKNANNTLSNNENIDVAEARETLDILYEISQILNCGLDRSTLSLLVSLCENGVNPEALALVVKELRRESEALKNQGKI